MMHAHMLITTKQLQCVPGLVAGAIAGIVHVRESTEMGATYQIACDDHRIMAEDPTRRRIQTPILLRTHAMRRVRARQQQVAYVMTPAVPLRTLKVAVATKRQLTPQTPGAAAAGAGCLRA